MDREPMGGRYELRGVLGRGGMAEVRDGWDTRLHRAVAIKLLHPALGCQPDSRRRFEAEARSAAALNHPNIVAVHDSGEHDGTPYIVMERLPGRSLEDMIAQGPLPQHVVRAMLDQVLAALAAAHEAGILHRDIKPGNILFAKSGDAKVTDFGIAKSAELNHTLTGQVVGTVAYLSPERLAGRPASVADDLYAVGVVGYEALAGRRPFVQENFGALARAIIDDWPVPLAQLRPDVDPMLIAVIERAMAKDPAQRFGSAHQMRAAVAGDRMALAEFRPAVAGDRPAVAGDRPAPAAAGVRPPTMVLTSPIPPMAPIAAPPRRRRLSRNAKLLAAIAALFAVAVAAIAFAFDNASRSVPAAPVVTSSTLPPPPPVNTPTTSLPLPIQNFEEPPPAPRGRGHHHDD